MTDAHKAQLAKGRTEAKAVREYLEFLQENAPKRGRKRTPASVEARLAVIEEALEEASPIERLQLIQERRDLTAELAVMQTKTDGAAFEKAFIKVAKSYSQSKGIDYASWREIGVSAAILAKAGVRRGA